MRIRDRLWLLRANIKTIRLRPVPAAFDFSPERNLRWHEIRYCALGWWRTIIALIRKGEHVPSGIAIIGHRMTLADLDWAREKALELEGGDAK